MTPATLTRADLLALHAYNAGVEAARAAYDADPLAVTRAESRTCYRCKVRECWACSTEAYRFADRRRVVACRCWVDGHGEAS